MWEALTPTLGYLPEIGAGLYVKKNDAFYDF